MDQELRRSNGENPSSDSLINTLYEHAVSFGDDCSWCELLAGLCKAMGASAGGFLRHDLSTQQSLLRHRYNIPQNSCDARVDSFPSTQSVIDQEVLSSEGQVVFGADRPEGHEPFLNQSPQALRSLLHNINGVVWTNGAQAYLISLFRSPDAPPFGPHDEEFLVRLLPHLKRSHSLRAAIQRDRQLQQSLRQMVDRLPAAFLLVRPSGRVEFSNALAQSMLAHGNGISLSPEGYITTRFQSDTVELRRLIRIASMSSDGNAHGNGEHFMISRGAGRLPLICVVHPANALNAMSIGGREAGATLLIKDPNVECSDDLADFSAIYRLTGAERRLTQLLVDGLGLFEAASKLGITKNTARTHMRNIYSKIGTNRQTDLIRLHGQLRMY